MPADKMPWPTCEWGNCQRPVSVWFETSWTAADWLEAMACEAHATPMFIALTYKTVEGFNGQVIEHEFDNINGLYDPPRPESLEWSHDR